MINNDLLRRLSTIFDLTDDQVINTFALTQCDITKEHLIRFFKEKDDESYQEIDDAQFACFLNGLIIAKRGPNDGPARPAELALTNNMKPISPS